MLKVQKRAPDRLDLEVSGSLSAEAMRDGLAQLIEESADITDGKMLYRISDFELPTLGALAVEFRQMPKLLSLVGKFNKCAVLSDAAWIRNSAEIEGMLIPGLEIRSFPLDAANLAEAWLTDAETTQNDSGDENFPI